MGIAIAKGDRAFYIPIAHKSWMDEAGENLEPPTDLLKGVQGELVFHNAKFDLHVLRRLGVQIPEIKIYDTLLMAHLINENRFSYSLDSLSTEILGVSKMTRAAKHMKDGWEEMPAALMGMYAEHDAKITLDLYNSLKTDFLPYEEVWDVDEKFMLVLQAMEQKGVAVDVEYARILQGKCIARLKEIADQLGIDPAKPSQLHKKLFGVPPEGYGLKITQTTPNGKPQVNTYFLEHCNHPVAGLLLEWRNLQKQLTSYYNAYLDRVEDYGRLHADFQQHGTVTGRLSCKDPNMQQIPRESPVKKLFLADPGKQLWEVDYKNIEMRLAMVYANEPKMLDIFRNEGDVHQSTADALGITRQQAKVVNFLIIFGGREQALSVQLGCTWKKAKEILEGYKREYSNLFAVMDQATYAGEVAGEVRLWSGRKRHFKWSSEAKKAFNSLVQGGSFEIVKRSMIQLHAVGFDIRSQVHDSVWLMVDNENQIREAEHIMADWTEEMFGLKFSVESKRLN